MVTGLGWLRRAGVRRTEKFGLQERWRLWRCCPALLALPALSGGAAAQAIPAQPALAKPALWVVSDADTIIYLFGTFHAHDGQARWFDRAVKTAFDGSDELVLETLVPENSEALSQALGRYRAASGRTGTAAPSPGLTDARTAMTAARSAGLSVSLGADAVLRRAASATGKRVGGLEPFELQLRMYDRLPGSAAARAQATPAAPNHAIAAFMRQMQAAWNRGDPATFEAVVGAVHAHSPVTYRLMFEERNAEWAGWIAERLRQPGTVFVAVGTGHLVGRDSVQAKLAARGIRSARIS